jgi:hypothetical protein
MISLFPLSFMDIMPENVSGFEQALYAIIIIIFFTLWSFIDIIGHFITIYLIDHSKMKAKYPRLKPILNYFKKTNYVFLAFEIIFVISTYLVLIGVCIRLLYEI